MTLPPTPSPPPGPEQPLIGVAHAPVRPLLRWPADWTVVRTVVVACVTIALFVLAWQIIDVFLLVFAAALLAIALHGLADGLCWLTRLPRRYAILPVTLLMFGGIGLVLWLFGATIRTQTAEVVNLLPGAWKAVEDRFHIDGMGLDLLRRAEQMAPSGATILTTVQGVTSNVFQLVLGVFLVIVGGLYFALDPMLYRRLFLTMWPPRQRSVIARRLDAVGGDLLNFLKAQLMAMVVVGALTYAGLTMVGLPSALALGLFAGLAEFIPMIGPIMAAVPALLIASTLGLDTVLWTLAVFLVVQQSESNLISPLLQQRMVSLPPAVTLFAVVAFGNLLGPMGIFLATPLTVLIFAAVRGTRHHHDAGRPRG